MLKFLTVVLLTSCLNCIKCFDSKLEPMCIKENSSCTYLFGDHLPSDFCWKVFYNLKNQSVCDTVFKEDTIRTGNSDLGKLILTPIYDVNGPRTTINVSFIENKWNRLKILFQQFKKNGLKVMDKAPDECMVKDFILKDRVAPNSTFSYVCPWTDQRFEGQIVDFHYEYGVDEYDTRRKYRFLVPIYQHIRDNATQFFTYVDYTDLYNLILKIQPLTDQFNGSQYKVEVVFTLDDETQIKASDVVSGLEYNFYTGKNVGYYHFRVGQFCENNTICEMQETPMIFIPSETPALLIGMVGVALLIPIFMIIVYMWTNVCPGLPKPANVLLVTTPTNNAHAIVAPAFAKFLQETYKINVMLDIHDVPQTDHGDSFKWLKLAINHASHIIYLRSNDDLAENRVIYRDIYIQTLHLLNPRFNPKRKIECIVSFSYSSSTTGKSNPDLVHIPASNRFSFPDQCNKLIEFMIKKTVPLNRNENASYRNLLDAITLVENERPARNQDNVLIRFDEPQENHELHAPLNNIIAPPININPINPELDLENYNLLGEPKNEPIHIDENSDADQYDL